MNSSHLSHKSKGLFIIDTIFLIVPEDNKSSFITIQTSIRVNLKTYFQPRGTIVEGQGSMS